MAFLFDIVQIIKWRDVNTKWDDDQSLETLEDEITALCKARGKKCPLKIVMMGPVGAGKSSFINTIDSVYTGYVTCQAWSASSSGAGSTTSKYQTYQLGEDGEPPNFVLCDTKGIGYGYEISEQDLKNCIAGNIPNGYEFNTSSHLQIESPSITDDKSHCVCLVFDATKYNHLPREVVKRCRFIIKELKENGTPCIVLVTKIDLLSKMIATNLTKVYHSGTLKQVFVEIEHSLGINPRQIVPVKNYHDEQELSTNVDILACLALRQMVRAAKDGFRAFQNSQ